MRERVIEEYLVRCVEALDGRCIKFESASARGLPDRIVMLPRYIGLVELKGDNGRLRPLQKWWEEECSRLEIPYTLISSKEEVDEFLRKARGLHGTVCTTIPERQTKTAFDSVPKNWW